MITCVREVDMLQVKVRTGWDEADSNSAVRSIVNGVETINFPKVSQMSTLRLIFFF